MKSFFSRYFKTHAVLMILLLAAAATILYRKHTNPAKPDQTKPVVYYLSDELHFAAIPYEAEQEHKTGKVHIDKAALRAAFPVPKGLGATKFMSMEFLVPGKEGLADPAAYFATKPIYRRDDNVVTVWQIEPWGREDYARVPPGARDRRSSWTRTGDYWVKHPPQEMYGMQCYDPGDSKYCLGEILPGEWAVVDIDNIPDRTKSPNALLPLMKVSYFTKAYGGLTIQWRTHAMHATKWREVDAKFWQLMHERNVLEQP